MSEISGELIKNTQNEFIVYRQVTHADRLLAALRHVGERVFGHVAVGDLVEPVEDSEQTFGITVKQIVSLEQPKIVVYRAAELELRMFELFAPKESNMDGKFRYAAHKMFSHNEKVYKPVARTNPDGSKFRTSNLYPLLDRIALSHGVIDQTNVPISLIGLHQVDSPEVTYGTRLSLVLNPGDETTRMFIEQSHACREAVADVSRRLTIPSGSSSLHIPCCELPDDVTATEMTEFTSGVARSIIDTRLTVTGIDYRVR